MLHQVHLKIAHTHLFISSVSRKYVSWLYYIPVYTDVSHDGNSVGCAKVFMCYSFSIRHLIWHPHLLNYWQSLKPRNKSKILVHQNTLFLQTQVCVMFYSNNIIICWNISWLGWPYGSVFLNFANRYICFVRYLAVLTLKVTKSRLCKSVWICLMSRLMYPILIKHISQYILSIEQKLLKWCQASTGRLVVLLQTVQEGWHCLVAWSHQSYTFDPQFTTFWWSAIILFKIYWKERCAGII